MAMRTLLFFMLMLLCVLSVQAQDEFPVIAADNAPQLQEIAYFGNGRLTHEVAWSTDGNRIAAAGTLGVWIYDAHDLNVPSQFLEGHTQPVISLAFSPDGQTLASSSHDGTIILWDFPLGTQRFVLPPFPAPYQDASIGSYSLTFRADGVLASGDYGLIHFWDVNTGEEILPPLELCRDFVSDIAFSADGTKIACTGESHADYEGGEVAVWDFTTDREIELEGAYPFDGYSVQFSADGSQVNGLIFHRDRVSWTWNLEDGSLMDEADESPLPIPLNDFSDWGVPLVEYNSDASHFAYIENDSLIVGDTQTGETVSSSPFFVGRISNVDLSADGTQLAVRTADGTRVWDAQTGAELEMLDATLAFHPLDADLIARGGDERDVNLVNIDTGETLMTFATEGAPLDIQFSADGTVLASHTENVGVTCASLGKVHARQVECDVPNFYVWDIATGNEILSARMDDYFTFALSSDGSRLATFDRAMSALWQLPSGESQPIPEIDDAIYSFINRLTFNPDDTMLAAGTGGGVLGGNLGASTLWIVDSDEVPTLLGDWDGYPEVPHGAVYAVAFNADGTLMADTTGDIHFSGNTVRVWDVSSRQSLAVLDGHHDEVTDVVFSPDGSLIYSSGMDGTVRVWAVSG